MGDVRDLPEGRLQGIQAGCSPGGQGPVHPSPDRGVRFPSLPGDAVLRQQQVQCLAGGIGRVPAVVSGKHQRRRIVQRLGEHRQQLVIRHGGRQFRLLPEDGPVGSAQILQPVLIGRQMDAGRINIGGEISHTEVLSESIHSCYD